MLMLMRVGSTVEVECRDMNATFSPNDEPELLLPLLALDALEIAAPKDGSTSAVVVNVAPAWCWLPVPPSAAVARPTPLDEADADAAAPDPTILAALQCCSRLCSCSLRNASTDSSACEKSSLVFCFTSPTVVVESWRRIDFVVENGFCLSSTSRDEATRNIPDLPPPVVTLGVVAAADEKAPTSRSPAARWSCLRPSARSSILLGLCAVW
mmetsp:Transcript_24783/g.62317  ORF Transcript_24783/g.62317 Transcript_24783/m.62317 type:complete len:211 (+) Transcript_24783:3029-3661(+)